MLATIADSEFATRSANHDSQTVAVVASAVTMMLVHADTVVAAQQTDTAAVVVVAAAQQAAAAVAVVGIVEENEVNKRKAWVKSRNVRRSQRQQRAKVRSK